MVRTVRPAVKSISVKIPAQTYYQVREIAETEGKVIAYLIDEAVKKHLLKRRK